VPNKLLIDYHITTLLHNLLVDANHLIIVSIKYFLELSLLLLDILSMLLIKILLVVSYYKKLFMAQS
jgi:hypothetical protein